MVRKYLKFNFKVMETYFFWCIGKNYEAEQQIKFFQSQVAAAFSERDRAIMEVFFIKLLSSD